MGGGLNLQPLPALLGLECGPAEVHHIPIRVQRRQYCSDEFFLMNYIEPYLASHKVKRANRGVIYTGYSQKVCKPYMRMLEEDGMENIKKRRAPKRDLVIPEFRMTLRARTV